MSAENEAIKTLRDTANNQLRQAWDDLTEDPESFEHAQLQPNKAFGYLGGGERDQNHESFPLCETFKALPRLASLPPLSAITSSTGETEEALLKCWNGDFAAKWRVVGGTEDDGQNFSLVLFVYVKLASCQGSNNIYPTLVHDSIGIDTDILGTRILHHLLRQNGATMPSNAFECARRQLIRSCHDEAPNRRSKEILDLHILSIDVAVTNRQNGDESWISGALGAGAQLFAMNRVEEATNFVVQCHKHGNFLSRDSEIRVLRLALQFLRCSDYLSDLTEFMSIRFLHLSFSDNIVENPFEKRSIEAAIILLLQRYLVQAVELAGDNKKSDDFKKTAVHHQLLIGVFFAAGFRPNRKGCKYANGVFYEAADNQMYALNKKLRLRKDASMAFLKEAFAAPDVDSFWRIILTAGKPSKLKLLQYQRLKGIFGLNSARRTLARRVLARGLHDSVGRCELFTICHHCDEPVPLETS